MRANRTPGSVRGAPGNRCPYLDISFPQHNAILALVVLTIPPLLVAWICGYRQPKELVTVAVLLSALTLALTVTFGKLTGVSTGMIEPILVRALAGFLAGTIVVWHAAQPRPVA